MKRNLSRSVLFILISVSFIGFFLIGYNIKSNEYSKQLFKLQNSEKTSIIFQETLNKTQVYQDAIDFLVSRFDWTPKYNFSDSLVPVKDNSILIQPDGLDLVSHYNVIKIYGQNLTMGYVISDKSSSMNPTMNSSTSIIVQTPARSFEVGDIIIYDNHRGDLVNHRIVEINSTCIYTKGDDNIVIDNYCVQKEDIEGKVVGIIYGRKV